MSGHGIGADMEDNANTGISRKLLLGGVAAAGFAAGLRTIGASAATAGVVGAWSLDTFEERTPDGSFKPRFGPGPVGYLIYTASGRVSATLSARHRAPFRSPDAAGSTKAQSIEAVHNFLAYAGRYEVHEKYVLHHIETSIFTDLVGVTLKRGYTLAGNTLTIRTLPPYIWGTESVLVWRRT
jgi:hypothetical protein